MVERKPEKKVSPSLVGSGLGFRSGSRARRLCLPAPGVRARDRCRCQHCGAAGFPGSCGHAGRCHRGRRCRWGCRRCRGCGGGLSPSPGRTRGWSRRGSRFFVTACPQGLWMHGLGRCHGLHQDGDLVTGANIRIDLSQEQGFRQSQLHKSLVNGCRNPLGEALVDVHRGRWRRAPPRNRFCLRRLPVWAIRHRILTCTGQLPCNLQTHFTGDRKSPHGGNRVGALGDQRPT